MLEKQQKKYRCHKRVKGKISGTSRVPRLGVFRSERHIYAQLIDDERGKTLASVSDREISKLKVQTVKHKITKKSPLAKASEGNEGKKTRKVAIAFEVGKLIAEKALKGKISKVVFDRGGYRYHGRIKAVAEGARENGLKF